MRNFVIGAILATVISSSASAADWVEVGNDDESMIYFDRASLTPAGRHFSFWEKTLVKPAAKEAYSERRTMWLIDCQNKLLAIKSVVAYDASGHVYAGPSTTSEYALPWDAIVPESNGDAYYSLICR